MGKDTGIAWTRSTRNLWTGCTKVGPGCDGCYAEAFQRFVRGKDPESGEAKNWGPGRARISHLEGAFRDLRRWNRKAAEEAAAGVTWKGRVGFWPVFLNTQSDFFDNEAPQAWRDAAFPVIEECTNLRILLVTKRVGNVARMVPDRWMREGFPSHVRLLITVVNDEEARRDIPKLLELPCHNGISYEPALEQVSWRQWLPRRATQQRHDIVDAIAYGMRATIAKARPLRSLEWIIVGGESAQGGHAPRPFYASWARRTVMQSKAAGVPVFVKQMGSFVIDRNDAGFDGCDETSWGLRPDGSDPLIDFEPHGHVENYQGADCRIVLADRAGADPAEWPEDLRVQEFPA